MSTPTTPADLRPRFEHDCDRCRFLGTVATPLTTADLYVCPEAGRTYIARYSDHGPDYSSLPDSMDDRHHRPELRVAKLLANRG